MSLPAEQLDLVAAARMERLFASGAIVPGARAESAPEPAWRTRYFGSEQVRVFLGQTGLWCVQTQRRGS